MITEENTAVADDYGYGIIKRTIIDESKLKQAVQKAGRLISEKYYGKPLLLVSILKGSFIFASDLFREIKIPCEIGFMAAESYGEGTVSSGEVNITLDLKHDISKYHVIIAEDICDTGITLSKIYAELMKRKPLSLRVVCLLDKPSRRKTDFKPDHALFEVPDLFLVGYGLDFSEKMRNLPYIAEADLH